MVSEVFFWSDLDDVRGGCDYFLERIAKDFAGGETAFKIHFGESGNVTHLRPGWVRGIPDFFQDACFVESNVLYRGSRTVREDHLRVAKEHGFDFLPIDILDGERGEEEVLVHVGSERTEDARLGAGIEGYHQFVALTHFKGHMATGFGGVLKNIGMGCGSRAGKLDMHSLVSPYVVEDKCVACGVCASHCPADAITIEGKASIDSDRCIGCVHCISYCPEGAVEIPWDMSMSVNRALMEKIADYSYAAIRGRSWAYISFITDVTPNCDCMGIKEENLVADIGVLYSRDPVALEAACLDLVSEASGGGDPFLKLHGVDGRHILEYAEKIGLGCLEYDLVKV